MKDELLSQIREAVGKTVTLTVEGYFGNKVDVTGKITNTPVQHGYYSEEYGWALYQGKHINQPDYVLGFLPKGKRKPRAIKLSDVLAVNP